MYGRFNWECELENFWESVKILKTNKDSSVPLYAHILFRYFWDDRQNVPLLENLSKEAGKWKLFNYEMQKDSIIPVFDIENEAILPDGKKNRRSGLPDTKPVSTDQYYKKGHSKSSKNMKPKLSASFSNSNGTFFF